MADAKQDEKAKKVREVPSRKYFPAKVEGGPDTIMTSAGVVSSSGLDAKELTADQCMELEQLVQNGVLRAEGDRGPIERHLRRDSALFDSRHITRGRAEHRPYDDKVEAYRETRPAGGTTMSSIQPEALKLNDREKITTPAAGQKESDKDPKK